GPGGRRDHRRLPGRGGPGAGRPGPDRVHRAEGRRALAGDVRAAGGDADRDPGRGGLLPDLRLPGPAGFFIEAPCPDLAVYEQVLLDQILAIPQVVSAQSTFEIRTVMNRGPLPLDHWK